MGENILIVKKVYLFYFIFYFIFNFYFKVTLFLMRFSVNFLLPEAEWNSPCPLKSTSIKVELSSYLHFISSQLQWTKRNKMCLCCNDIHSEIALYTIVCHLMIFSILSGYFNNTMFAPLFTIKCRTISPFC